MSDLIDRRAAIDALGGEPIAFTEYEQGLHDKWVDAKENIEALPSAQPEKRTEKRTETHACDCISRREAIDAVTAWLHRAFNPLNRAKHNEGEIDAYKTALSELKKIPSVQPDAMPVVRCEHCAHKKNCQWYYYSGDDYGFCNWAVREEHETEP